MDIFPIPDALQREIDTAAGDPASHWSPGRDEAWWWLWFPPLAALAIIITFRVAEPFYRAWILPEGYGVLELSQFFFAAMGCVIALRLLFRPYVRRWGLIWAAVLIFAIACFYIAGEEHSWGQHFFHWQTPEYWSQINRQQETNLHNTYEAANHLPQVILEIGILVGGILVPLWQQFVGPFRHGHLQLFAPSAALMPTALCVALFKVAKKIGNDDAALDLVTRPSEAMEFFFYLFILYYLIVFARRIRALEAASGVPPK